MYFHWVDGKERGRGECELSIEEGINGHVAIEWVRASRYPSLPPYKDERWKMMMWTWPHQSTCCICFYLLFYLLFFSILIDVGNGFHFTIRNLPVFSIFTPLFLHLISIILWSSFHFRNHFLWSISLYFSLLLNTFFLFFLFFYNIIIKLYTFK